MYNKKFAIYGMYESGRGPCIQLKLYISSRVTPCAVVLSFCECGHISPDIFLCSCPPRKTLGIFLDKEFWSLPHPPEK